jgi:hypothetical protein
MAAANVMHNSSKLLKGSAFCDNPNARPDSDMKSRESSRLAEHKMHGQL